MQHPATSMTMTMTMTMTMMSVGQSGRWQMVIVGIGGKRQARSTTDKRQVDWYW
jgi:hypothetical protein